MSDDLPTVPMNQPDSPAGAAPGPDGPRRNRTPLIVMSVIAGLLLIAVVVLLTLLLSGRLDADEPTPLPSSSTSEEPSASPEPSDEPSDEVDATTEPTTEPTETSAPPPPPPAIISSFSASTKTVDCSGEGTPQVTFSWSTSGAKVNFGVATEFADTNPYQPDLRANGSVEAPFPCSNDSQVYSIAVFDSSNTVIARQSLTVNKK